MKQAAVLFVVPLLALFVTACTPDPVDTPPPSATLSTEPSLPPGFVAPPGSEIERRIEGTCILFDPWNDGSGRRVCIMTTPQNGRLGRLTTEDEGLDGGGIGAAREALRDGPPAILPSSVNHRTEYLDGCLTVSNQQACGWCAVQKSVRYQRCPHPIRGHGCRLSHHHV